MQSPLTEQTADPHDSFGIDPEIALAMHADLVEHQLARAASPAAAPSISIAPGPIAPSLIPASHVPSSHVPPGHVPPSHGAAVQSGAGSSVNSGPNLSGLINPGPRAAGPRPASPLPSSVTPKTMSDFSAGGLVPPVDPRFAQAGVFGDIHVPPQLRSKNRWAARTSYGFLIALGSTIALAVWDQYGNAAQALITRYIPPLGVITAQAPKQAPAAAPADIPGTQVASADPSAAAPVQTSPTNVSASAPPVPAAPAAIAPANPPAVIAATTATESGPTTQAMAHDMAAMGQQIEALKATVEQLRAGQDQMSQQLSRLSAPKPVAAIARPVAPPRPQVSALPPMHRPRPAVSPEMANAALGAPPRNLGSLPPAPQPAPMQYQSRGAQVIDRNDGDPVGRPPMPVQ
jgi:hypothetical protein